MRTYDELLQETIETYNKGEFKAFVSNATELYKRNRLNLYGTFFYAIVMEQVGDYLESYEKFSILYKLQNIYNEKIISEENLLEKIDELIDKAVANIDNIPIQKQEQYKEKLVRVNAMDTDISKNYFAITDEIEDFYGVHTFCGVKTYVARYDNMSGSFINVNKNRNAVESKCEIFSVDSVGNEIFVDEKKPCILPVVANTGDKETDNLMMEFIEHGTNVGHKILNAGKETYEYYRLNESTSIRYDKQMVFGKKIPLVQNDGLKKLVLSIFIDSFNWKVIKENKLEELMPNTYEFFSKGVICDEFYSGSEFTYPSVASYWTGLRSTHHHTLNQNVHFPIPDEYPVITEIFKEEGYFTGKIGGNDTVVPNYGYMRGVDRFVFQRAEQGFHIENVVSETLEHIEAFKDTNMFLWMDIMDLHEVAGYWPRPVSMQTKLSYKVNEIDNEGGSSLYQTPSPNRRKVYEEQLRRLDWKLKDLYQYIESNYNKEEVVITLFSDHGNGFNVEDGEYFMSSQRMNVPFMIYGADLKPQRNNDIIETVDYGHIISKIAGINTDKLNNDGQVPFFLGGEKKEYAFSQSLFPDRYYEAAIFTETYEFYFRSKYIISNDCRVSLQDGTIYLIDKNRVEFIDEEINKYCMSIIEEMLGDYKV